MGKRKRSGDDDYSKILRKIKKLEAKLRKRRHRSSPETSSESDYEDRRYYSYETDMQGDEILNLEEEDIPSQPTHHELDYYDAPPTRSAQFVLPVPAPLAETVPSARATPSAQRAPSAAPLPTVQPPYAQRAPSAAPLPTIQPPYAQRAPSAAPLPTVQPPPAPAPAPADPLAVPTCSAPLPVLSMPGEALAPSAPPALMCNSNNFPSNTDEVHAAPITDEHVPPLDPEILQLLGEDPNMEKKYGADLHKDIVSRWTHILTNGLPKEAQLELIKKYLPPKNCPNVSAPKLNLEIKAALSDINIKKDLYSQSKQNQLSTSLSALGHVLNWALSSNNNVPQDIIKALGDAGRLICDSHYRESLSRRFATLNTLNKNIRDTVKNTQIDEHLFGADLTDHIKSSKAISKTGADMKPLRPAYRPPVAQFQRGALNSRGAPPRIPAATEPRPTPTPRRPPRDRRLEAPRGRRYSNYTRHHQRPRRR